MDGANEIKCPHCGEWTAKLGHKDEKCPKCNGFLEPQRFSRHAEKSITKENFKKTEYLPIKASDGPITRELKGFINALGWIVFYSEIAFYGFVTLLIMVVGIIAG
jgi:hypothetical protein